MRAARTDDNQKEIVDALRKVGCSVSVSSNVGGGFPDLCIGFKSINYFFEIKDPNKPPSQRKLTPAQVNFHGGWRGQIDVIETVDEAFNLMGITKG